MFFISYSFLDFTQIEVARVTTASAATSIAEQFPSAQTDRLRSMRAMTRNAGEELIKKARASEPPN